MTDLEALWTNVERNPQDFSSWTTILDIIDKQPDHEKTRQAFKMFLEHFPLCYGYWKKYAEFERQKSGRKEAFKVYADGIEAIPMSVDLWIAYADTAAEIYQSESNYFEVLRSIYEKGLDWVGMDFRSDAFWEHYISWETSYNNYHKARLLYERLLATPTQMYYQNWDSFKKMIEENHIWTYLTDEETAQLHAQVNPIANDAVNNSKYGGIIIPEAKKKKLVKDSKRSSRGKEPKKKRHKHSSKDKGNKSSDSESSDCEAPKETDTRPVVEDEDGVKRFRISINEEEAIKQLVILSREKIYQDCYNEIMKRWYFEEKIRRPYFHIKPLEDVQITNWAEYISYEEDEAKKIEMTNNEDTSNGLRIVYPNHSGRKRVRVLYERALVACALYEHMWIRFAKYLEHVENDFVGALKTWNRACHIHLRQKVTINFHYALFLDSYQDKILSMMDKATTDPNKDFDEFRLMSKKNWPTNPLDLMTRLESSMPNSALVCSRRADFIRRETGKFLDVMMCLRSGINRLRHSSSEHYLNAFSVEGESASVTASRYLLLSSQERVGAGFLVCKMARLFLKMVPAKSQDEKVIPEWQLLLNVSYNPIKKPVEGSKFCAKRESENVVDCAVTKVEQDSENKVSETENNQDETNEEEPVEEMDVGSPPILKSEINVGEAKSGTPRLNGIETSENVKMSNSIIEEKQPEDESIGESADRALANGDTSGEVKRDSSANSNGDQKSEMKTSDDDPQEDVYEFKPLKDKTLLKITVLDLPDSRSYTEEHKRLLTCEEAAIKILEEHLEYDLSNERVFNMLLDITFQRRPLDLDSMVDICDRAILNSTLPEEHKLSFFQRKVQILEEFQDDNKRISRSYEEMINFIHSMHNHRLAALATSAAAQTTSGIYQGDPRDVQSLSGVDPLTRTSVQIYKAHPYPDMLNNPIQAVMKGSHQPNCLSASAGVITKGRIDLGQEAFNSSLFGQQIANSCVGKADANDHYTGGAFDPMSIAQGNMSGLPPKNPNPQPMHPPMGDPGNSNAAWKKAAAAVANTVIVENVAGNPMY